MNTALNWLAAALLALALSAAHLLDGPSDTEAAADVAADVLDAQHTAMDVARFSARMLMAGGEVRP